MGNRKIVPSQQQSEQRLPLPDLSAAPQIKMFLYFAPVPRDLVHERQVGRLEAPGLHDGQVEEDGGGGGVPGLREEGHRREGAGGVAAADNDLRTNEKFA